MNLDLDTLREMISSTLQEMSASEDTNPETTAKRAAEEATEAAEEAEKAVQAASREATEEKTAAEAEKERQKNLSSEPPLEESFQITKGRLRQIIAEELISAKKQGIL